MELKHEDPRRSTKIHEGAKELDTMLRALFRQIQGPAPSVGFAARTMTAIVREPLPADRRPLRSPLTTVAAWAAMIAGVAVSGSLLAANQPVLASAFTALVSGGIGVGVWLVQFVGAGLELSDVCATAGLAVSRAVITREGSVGLMLVATVGALSLSALHRLLMSQGLERGVSQ